MTEKKTLLFIPAKNEAKTIASVITDAQSVFTDINIAADILVIDDGSNDGTESTAKHVGAHTIRHEQSRGLGSIFKEAVDYAIEQRYDFLVTIDGDKQFSEKEIPLLLNPLLKNKADFCSGNRFLSGNNIKHMSKTKKTGNALVAHMVNYILNTKYTDVSCGFRAYSREALLHLNLQGGYTYTQEVFLNLGYKKMCILEVPIHVTYYPTRTSRIANKIFNYGYQVLKIMISSLLFYRPMKFFGTITALLWLPSLLAIVILGMRYLETGLITPYKAIGVLAILGFGLGLILLLVGVILYSLSRQQLSIDNVLYYAKKRD